MYPLKFEDILRPMIWGGEEISRFKQLPEVHPGIGESWEISQVGDRISVVSEGEDKGKTITELIKRDGANLLGEHVAARYADKFPLLIKFIEHTIISLFKFTPMTSWRWPGTIHSGKPRCGMSSTLNREQASIRDFLSK